MSMVIYVGLDVHLNSVAAVWGKAKDKPRSMKENGCPLTMEFPTLILR